MTFRARNTPTPTQSSSPKNPSTSWTTICERCHLRLEPVCLRMNPVTVIQIGGVHPAKLLQNIVRAGQVHAKLLAAQLRDLVPQDTTARHNTPYTVSELSQ